jgi:Amt family ammonium transporter
VSLTSRVADAHGHASELIHGTTDLIVSQVLATLAVGVYTIFASPVILLVVDRTAGLRVVRDDEDLGLDLTQHGQRG